VRLALLANPRSGAGDAGEVQRLLTARGAEVEAFGIDECDAAVAAGPDRMVVAGGDGSVGCAAQAAGRAGVPLAVIPAGTANDFARALGLPREVEAAAALAVEGDRTRPLDLGLIGSSQPFVNAVSAGLSPLAAQEAHGLKSMLGPFAYAVGALRAGVFAQPVAAEVQADGREVFSGPAWQVTVGLTGAFGGGAEVEADPHDGELDVVAIESGSRLGLVMRAYGMRAGRLERQRGVVTAAGREVELAIDGDAGFNVDGEIVEEPRLRLSVEPHAFELVVG
jgi:diacylglycerol kinase family enzyme